MEIRDIKKEEMKETLELVWETFLEYEAPDYTEEGIAEFKKTIEDKSWVEEREFIGAFEGKNVVGVIATKDITHIALFFVDGKYHRRGIGRKLYEEALRRNSKGYFTVNSSPYANEIYKHLGFVDTDTEQCINGLKFIPMRMEFCLLTERLKIYPISIEKMKEVVENEKNEM